jgi:hypothetical protein
MTTAKRRLQEQYRRETNEVMAAKRAAGLKNLAGQSRMHEDARRLMDEVPQDTRDLTARLFGDPLPQRSALAQRNTGPSA